MLQKGDVLVSNFNNAENLQGTGTTICADFAERNAMGVLSEPGAWIECGAWILSNGIVIVGNYADGGWNIGYRAGGVD